MNREAHKRFIRQLPCIICGDNTSVECAHVRYGDRSVDKELTGMGRKPDDAFTVPLCGRHHREQHQHGEVHWWKERGIDAVKAALGLWRISGDYERGEKIVRYWMP